MKQSVVTVDDVTGEVTTGSPRQLSALLNERPSTRGNRDREREREGEQPSRGELITGFHEACPGVHARRKPDSTPLSSSASAGRASKQVAGQRFARLLLAPSSPIMRALSLAGRRGARTSAGNNNLRLDFSFLLPVFRSKSACFAVPSRAIRRGRSKSIEGKLND